MVSYSAKGINKFTAVNLLLPGRNRQNCECQLSCSAFNRFTHSNRRLLCSTHSGVTCHPYTRRRRRRAFDLALAGHFG